MAPKISKVVATHTKYIISFKASTVHQFFYCGPLPIIKPPKIILEGISVLVSDQYTIDLSAISLTCDCGMQYHLHQIPHDHDWNQALPHLHASPRVSHNLSTLPFTSTSHPNVYPTLDFHSQFEPSAPLTFPYHMPDTAKSFLQLKDLEHDVDSMSRLTPSPIQETLPSLKKPPRPPQKIIYVHVP
jgi:hypothetical protein